MFDYLFKGESKLKWRDAMRLAIQSALAVASTYLIFDYFSLPEKFVGLISAVLVIETSIGNTMEQAKDRILATVIGSAIGFLWIWIIPWGIGTAISLAVTMFIINTIANFRPGWRYGVVASIAITLGSENNAIETGVDRIITIGIGVGVGIIISLIIWPDKSEKRALRFARRALGACCDKFEKVIKNSRREEDESTSSATDEFYRYLGGAKTAANAAKFVNKSQLHTLVEEVEKSYNSILILDRVANNSSNDVTDGDSGIEQEAEEVKECACRIMSKLAQEEDVGDDLNQELSDIIAKIREKINYNEEGHEVNTLRSAFLFGMNELETSLQHLSASFKKTLD